jgi:hypothetical protein
MSSLIEQAPGRKRTGTPVYLTYPAYPAYLSYPAYLTYPAYPAYLSYPAYLTYPASYLAVQPPSTNSELPVTNDDASDARKTAAPVNSCSSPHRPIGICFTNS